MTSTPSTVPPSGPRADGTRTVPRGCPLCEAMCGLEVTLDGRDRVVTVRGDADDVYSAGYLCPKGASLGAVDDDPDRLRGPLVRRDGELRPASWDEAFTEVDRLLRPLLADDRNSVAAYTGNPTGHNVAFTLLAGRLARSLGSVQAYSPATMDQLPQTVTAALLFGEPTSTPVPDLDATDLLVIVGGNPLVSNGSVGAAPDYRGRLRRLRARGGRVVVVDPAQTATAAAADLHLPIRPGTDLFLLLGLLHVVFAEDRVRLRAARDRVSGLAELGAAVGSWTPEAAGRATGIAPETIVGLARDIAGADRAALYGRLGTTLNRHGTLTCWALQVLNVVCGHLDRPGGMRFTRPVTGSPTTRRATRPARPFTTGRYHTRVSGHPEVLGEFPVAALAEEISTPGPGRVRGLVIYGGNLARSMPDSAAVQRALTELDALICVDPYLNETTRHAHVVLPPPGSLTRDHFDLVLFQFAQRNFARFSEPARPVPDGMLPEWDVLLRLCAIYEGRGPDTDPGEIDDEIAAALRRSVARGLDIDEREVVTDFPGRGPRRLLDMRIRSGPYGDLFGRSPGGLTLARLLDAPHGVDLGPLGPRLDEVVRTPSGRIELFAPQIREALAAARPPAVEPGSLLLIGRRDLRSKNSWLHNVDRLAGGPERGLLYLSPGDAEAYGIADGGSVTVRSTAGRIEVPVRVTDQVPDGVCSLAHGWGHDDDRARLRVAARRPGVNSNTLTDGTVLDPLSGTVQMNAIPVRVEPAPRPG
ncbi:molybdopterin-dependent oxidoreductase [Pseudonocardia nematodicida]|uniref:Molybdopterin-dependent oxidoreductase n=1 Tax=Pseudonocardia nematodicida TaxID=1206997 RepID=A0ABV1K5Z9_9PSEU